MRKKKKKSSIFIYLTLSFLFPVVILGIMFVFQKIHPFGNRQILIYDFRQQYYPFFSDYWHKLREGTSLLWSWTAGTGMDYLGLVAYYLASPLNLLIVLVPYTWLREALTVILLMKIGFAGLFLGMYLRYTFQKCNLSLPVFASLYALCAFTLGYYYNIMWFDTFALLPLVLLGLLAFVREGKFRLYIVSLALSVFCNYYIGFFTCIFVVLMFFSQCFIHKINRQEFFRKLILIIAYSVIAVGLTALLIIPAYSSLQNSYSTIRKFPNIMELYHSFIDILGNLIAFTPPTIIMSNGLPNLYCGMISPLLMFVFIRSPKVPIREKIVFTGMTVFLIISCNLNVLYYIWNGFHFANAIPYRFSFLISLTLVTMAYRAYLLIEDMDLWDLVVMGIASVLFLLMASIGPQEKIYIIGNIALCIVYLLIFAFSIIKKVAQRVLSMMLLVVILMEVSITSYIATKLTPYTEWASYPDNYNQIQQLLDMRQPANSNFYRTERTNWFIKNDDFLYGFDGISIFSSTVNANIARFMKGIGMASWSEGNQYYYTDASPLIDAFLNLRYLINRDGNYIDKDVYWKIMGQVDDLMLLENNRYLSLGFMVNEELAYYVHDGNNPFISQNDLFRRATGLDGDLFKTIDIIHVGHKNYDVVRKTLGNYSYSLRNNSIEGTLKWNYEIPADGMFYAYCKIINSSSAKVSVNGISLRSVRTKTPYIFNVGRFKQGELISIISNLKAEKGNAVIYVTYLNEELFDQGYALLVDEMLTLTKFTETEIEGSITALKDGLLYTSIPYEKNWKAFVDGIETEIQLVDGCMAAIPLGRGTHSIEFRYYNNSLIVGIIVSIISLVAFATFVILDILIRQKSSNNTGNAFKINNGK